MKAIVLCAGYGTRLGELTKDIPKPMLSINGRPLLEYIIANCRNSGYNEIAINLHFQPEMIRNFFGNGSRFGVRITYFYEEKLLGTAGSVKAMAQFVNGNQNFLVHYGDILTDYSLSDLYKAHSLQKSRFATILAHKRINSNSIIVVDQNLRITHFVERPSEEERKRYQSNLVNSGIAVLNRSVFDCIPEGFADLPKDVYSKYVCEKEMYVVQLNTYRCAIDSPERYRSAEEAVLTGKCNIEL